MGKWKFIAKEQEGSLDRKLRGNVRVKEGSGYSDLTGYFSNQAG